jgi:D-3-phosphoglycerate dehydrogenase / 2-oxoglutarate reductase
MPKVLIADKLSPAAVNVFRDKGIEVDVQTGLSKDELLGIIGEYDGLAVRSNTKPDADILAAATKLKVIGRAGIGVDNIDIKAATAKGMVVMNTPFGNAITTAEHAIAMMFAAARQIPEANASTQAGKWEKSRFVGTELYGKILGLIGCGNIGSLVAERARGLNMHVLAYDPFLTPERAIELGVEKVELEDVLARAQVISLHTPLTDKTRNILSAKALEKTREGVIIINCARGGLIDETALLAGLKAGHIRAAALDVYASEPARENPLFGVPGLVATPHLGASTREAQENVALQVAHQISDYLLNGAVTNALNMPSVSAEEAPRLRPFIDLAEKLGLLAGQLVSSGVKKIEVSYLGDVAGLNLKPLSSAALAGVLRPMLGDVNLVSAPVLAAERGIVLAQTSQEQLGDYESVISISVKTQNVTRTVAGSIFAGQPRIIEINGVVLDAPFSSHMLFVENEDQPGFIGDLGKVLGERNVNIATFNLGRKKAGGQAMALVGVDQHIDVKTLSVVHALPHVCAASALQF